jgi:legumain
MLYDDVANNEGNPFSGTLYNTPTGENVYKGCKKDYTGKQVTSSHFLNVISGNESGVPAGLPVLKSTAKDDVFIFYADPGALGFLGFPASHLYARGTMG